MKNKVYLSEVYHAKKHQIVISFDYNKDLIAICKQLDCSYSKTYKSWLKENTASNYYELLDRFKSKNVEIDQSKLLIGFKKRKLLKQREVLDLNLNEEAKEAVSKYKSYLISKNYSDQTIRSYIKSIGLFLSYYSKRDFEDIEMVDIYAFNSDFIIANNYSSSYQRQVISSIKLFYKYIVNSKFDVEDIERPRREKQLPVVLSQEEVKRMIESTVNLKHRSMLMVFYSTGIRRSELINLKLSDVNSDRMMIHIKQAKGKKDRYVPLHSRLLELLRDYIREQRPGIYLFEGHYGGPMSASSVGSIVKQASVRALIKENVSPHTLRHCFATHMLERGVDIRSIQEILGHNSLKTTEIYTHITKTALTQLNNPLDFM